MSDRSQLSRIYARYANSAQASSESPRTGRLVSFGERLAASRSALPGGTDDEVGQVVAESGWRLTVIVTAGRLGAIGSRGGAGA
jgi:hypothetical protein